MKKVLIVPAIAVILLSGCASVPMESIEKSEVAKTFSTPSKGASGIYIFRKDTIVGAALKKDVWIDRKCIGETAKGVFFYHEVEGNKEHTISTESEFSPNDLILKTNSGENYFIQQYVRPGIFVGGAGLDQYDVEKGRVEVSKLTLAKEGYCSTVR